MKKQSWWALGLIGASLIFMVSAYFGPCDNKLNKCFWGNSILYTRTLFHISLAILLTVPFIFFFSDKFFIKWLRFALIWFFLAIVFIVLAPVYTGGWISFGPTKESVSIWMSGLFVAISLGMFVREHLKK